MAYPKTRYGKCSKCGAMDYCSTHHKFKQKTWARALYGDLLDDPANCIYRLCNSKCHKDADANEILTEIEFCRMKGIMPRSKEGIAIFNRLPQEERWSIQ